MFNKVEADIDGKLISIETGKLAKQASGSIVISCGGTVVLVTVVGAKTSNPNVDFLPLTIEYQEKFSAVGRVPGNYFRREIGRPSDQEVLTCRIIDRPLRPLFPEGYRSETQVIATVLSADQVNSPDVLALTGASAALSISHIPFAGPVAGGRIAYIDGKYVLNPTFAELESSSMDLMVACTRNAIVMVEGKADELSEDEILGAIFFAFENLQPLINLQDELQRANGLEKIVVESPVIDAELKAKVVEIAAAGMQKVYTTVDKLERGKVYDDLKKEVVAQLDTEEGLRASEISSLLSDFKKTYLREKTVNTGVRIGGRAWDEIRDISSETEYLPKTHGSALFTRGETQALVTATLGSERDKQRVETLNGETSRRFMLHYNFPPYCVGEARFLRGPSRRDIGHGTLATRGLEAVLPSEEDFPYAIRVVSEILESNGSSSMASVCGGSMAMMDAGVPLKRPVSGIAMGLIKEGEGVAILSDILGDEDHLGDMDFKVVGTCDGITALQMDIKIDGVSRDIMSNALDQAKRGRMHILEEMSKGIAEARAEVVEHAPKYFIHKISQDKIRDIIGPGGKIIKELSAQYDAKIEVDDSGLVKMFVANGALAEALVERVKSITAEVEVGAVYTGKVKTIKDFGAFVEILPGTDGLVHISELALERVKDVTDVVNEGDTIEVKVLDVDNRGRIRLSRKALLG
ncbi:polyribonucleotide nucleotidyltransferase [Desulfotalea psychrophila]|uniref:Polyribonucleotide nucleotidyltransferase n=1 Tax=Desulfotalea psychrophila (strain LSv54 / DSM 12343) TaxID=177439 RepID=PNP_DESPS|nr:polyribonucleotide nucleotidyltransferase [Desulfotalea psychrophila]Q6AJY9.1 RecName: Full=Polyribonucleotide nucleotidyltransferase; AltName: Full=Polynucleotide phosphorylase; Short=PNPase [Desulfotalea psychrophila LSv54]CAG37337.1 probable polyribonucleotide nucleotidyltransferase [Desulfotalea psychrophila LSv54]